MATVRLVEIDADNWRNVATVKPHPDQYRFVADTTYYMCLAHYGKDWHSLAIVEDDQVVGHVMWAEDVDEASIWMGGLVIDAKKQGQGLGRATVDTFVERFTIEQSTHIALSYLPDNEAARYLYQDLGFVETGETADDEVVARLRK